MGPSQKYAQTTDQQTFVGISKNALFRIDPRLSGAKIAQDEQKTYASKMQFSSLATTGKGELVVASDKGDIRLYDKLDKRAKTHLPGIGGIHFFCILFVKNLRPKYNGDSNNP